MNITRFKYSFIKWTLLIFTVWSANVFSQPGNGQCERISISTRYEPLQGLPGIPTGKKYIDASLNTRIGRVVGDFDFVCKTHGSASSNGIVLGVYLAGASSSYKSGANWMPEAVYHSNVPGLVLKLPRKDEVTGKLVRNTGMKNGNYANEQNSILLERYGWGGDYGLNQVIHRTIKNVPIFYVHKISAVPSSASSKSQQIWFRSPVRFATYLHEYSSQWSHSYNTIQGPSATVYDPTCTKHVRPSHVKFGKVLPGGEVQRDFSIGIECPGDTSGNTKDVIFSFDLVSSPGVSVDAGDPTVAVYNKDGVKVRLNLVNHNSPLIPIEFGKKIKLESFSSWNRFNIGFDSFLKAESDSDSGQYEINVISNVEYN